MNSKNKTVNKVRDMLNEKREKLRDKRQNLRDRLDENTHMIHMESKLT